MRKIVMTGLALAVFVGLTALATAAEKKSAPGTQGTHRLTGEIVSVNAEAKTFTLKESVKKGTAEEVSFTLADKGHVMVHGKQGNLQELKSGDYVTVRYVVKDGRHIAQQVDQATSKG